ncbi:MAG: VOC family protein, partial [Haloarculaceae archaeon]
MRTAATWAATVGVSEGWTGPRRVGDPQTQFPGGPIAGMDLAHVALWVSDLEASLDFYCEGLG